MLALVALSESRSVPRQDVVSLLWSGTERAMGSARLRDVLHDLKAILDAAGVAVLTVDRTIIGLRPGAVQVEVRATEHVPGFDPWMRFLAELDNVDPSLDRWLAHARAEQRRRNASGGPDQTVAATTLPDASRPAVAVAQFETAGSDAGFAAAATAEVSAGLAKLRWFSTVTHTGRGARLKPGAANLAKLADYAVVGTAEGNGRRELLRLELIDLRGGCAVRWASSLSQEAQPGPNGLELLAGKAVARLDTELLLAEVERQRTLAPAKRNNAYSLVLQAVPGIYRLEHTAFLESGHLLEQAVRADPDSASAYSWLAYWHVFLVGQGWAANPFQSMQQAARASTRAMMLDPKDARSATIAGHVKAFMHKRLQEASTLHELALQLNPALPLAWHFAGMTHAYAGRLDEAQACLLHCRDLAPTDPLGFFAEGALGIVYLLQHEHQRAVLLGRRVTERHPNFTSALKSYLSALGHMGHRAEAARVLQNLLSLEPRFSLKRFHKTALYQRSSDLEHFTAGLRLAGLP